MVGIMGLYSTIKPGEPCYIVVKTGKSRECLEAIFEGVLPEGHPAWKKFQQKYLTNVKPVKAIVSDPAVGRRGIDPIALGHEPYRDYEVVSRREYVSRLQRELRELQKKQEAAAGLQEEIKKLQGEAGLVLELRKAVHKSAIHTEHLQQELHSYQRLLWTYLAIGAILGVAAALGAATYHDYHSAQKAADSLEIRIENQ